MKEDPGTGLPKASRAVPVHCKVVPDSASRTLAAGTYSFRAIYSGDANCNETKCACDSFRIERSEECCQDKDNDDDDDACEEDDYDGDGSGDDDGDDL